MFNRSKNKIVAWLMREPKPRAYPMCDFSRIQYELRVCDVILIEGKSRISSVIKSITQSAWSHAALYIGRIHDIEDPTLRTRIAEFYQGSPEDQLIIESMLGKGTVVSPLSDYNDAHIRICRPKGIQRDDAQKVIAYAIGRLGSEYAVRHNIDLARWLFPWSILPRRWRSSVFQHNLSESTKEICSSMLAEAFSSVSYPILPIVKETKEGVTLYHRNPRLFTPSDFDYSPYFEIIKYPIFELGSHAVYRNLPWNDKETVYTDEEDVGPLVGEPEELSEDASASDESGSETEEDADKV